MADPTKPKFDSFDPMIHRFFFCRSCKTHIAKIDEYSTHFMGMERDEPVFINVINVHILDPTVTSRLRDQDVVNVHCKKCDNLLGKQYFVTPNADGIPIVRDCMLDLKKLMKWDGEKIVHGSKSAEYSMLYQTYPQDFTIEPWFADSAARRAGLELYVLANRFDDDHQFFACRECKTEIAKAEDFLTHREGLELPEPVFSKVINVHSVKPSMDVQIQDCVVRDFCCNQCSNILGQQLLIAHREVNSLTRVQIDYTPYLTNFLKWDGDKFVDGK